MVGGVPQGLVVPLGGGPVRPLPHATQLGRAVILDRWGGAGGAGTDAPLLPDASFPGRHPGLGSPI